MSLEFILFSILVYVFSSIAIAKYLKNKKFKVKEKSIYIDEVKTFDRKKVNDYMYDPKFSNMSCNIHNPNSKFFKGYERFYNRQKKYTNEEIERIKLENHLTRDRKKIDLFSGTDVIAIALGSSGAIPNIYSNEDI